MSDDGTVTPPPEPEKKSAEAPAPEAPAPAAAAGNKNPEVWKAVAMLDHFEKIQKLDTADKINGVPNFRRVIGYKVYCCGQPTADGIERAIEKVCEIGKYPKDKPIIWINMRQEPIVYVNGVPVCARPANKIGEYAELGNVTSKCNNKSTNGNIPYKMFNYCTV